jgi:hypothetical protein
MTGPVGDSRKDASQMTSIFKAGYGEVNEFLGRLDRAGVSLERLRQVNRDASLADRVAQAFEDGVIKPSAVAQSNPFALPARTLIERFRQANQAQGWGITEDAFTRLLDTAPTLPEGRLAFRSFRIRFGEGQPGVEETANAHIAEIIRVHGEQNVRRWDDLRTDRKHLRLLAGNKTHKPTVEWCVIDLDAHRRRQSVTAVRGPKSIADEGLVLPWLYPGYQRSIDYKVNPGYYLAGYELHVPGSGQDTWSHAPLALWHLDEGKVYLCAFWRSDDGWDYAVPSLRE